MQARSFYFTPVCEMKCFSIQRLRPPSPVPVPGQRRTTALVLSAEAGPAATRVVGTQQGSAVTHRVLGTPPAQWHSHHCNTHTQRRHRPRSGHTARPVALSSLQHTHTAPSQTAFWAHRPPSRTLITATHTHSAVTDRVLGTPPAQSHSHHCNTHTQRRHRPRSGHTARPVALSSLQHTHTAPSQTAFWAHHPPSGTLITATHTHSAVTDRVLGTPPAQWHSHHCNTHTQRRHRPRSGHTARPVALSSLQHTHTAPSQTAFWAHRPPSGTLITATHTHSAVTDRVLGTPPAQSHSHHCNTHTQRRHRPRSGHTTRPVALSLQHTHHCNTHTQRRHRPRSGHTARPVALSSLQHTHTAPSQTAFWAHHPPSGTLITATHTHSAVTDRVLGTPPAQSHSHHCNTHTQRRHRPRSGHTARPVALSSLQHTHTAPSQTAFWVHRPPSGTLITATHTHSAVTDRVLGTPPAQWHSHHCNTHTQRRHRPRSGHTARPVALSSLQHTHTVPSQTAFWAHRPPSGTLITATHTHSAVTDRVLGTPPAQWHSHHCNTHTQRRHRPRSGHTARPVALSSLQHTHTAPSQTAFWAHRPPSRTLITATHTHSAVTDRVLGTPPAQSHSHHCNTHTQRRHRPRSGHTARPVALSSLQHTHTAPSQTAFWAHRPPSGTLIICLGAIFSKQAINARLNGYYSTYFMSYHNIYFGSHSIIIIIYYHLMSDRLSKNWNRTRTCRVTTVAHGYAIVLA